MSWGGSQVRSEAVGMGQAGPRRGLGTEDRDARKVGGAATELLPGGLSDGLYLCRTGITEGNMREERRGSNPVDQGPRPLALKPKYLDF